MKGLSLVAVFIIMGPLNLFQSHKELFDVQKAEFFILGSYTFSLSGEIINLNPSHGT